MDDVVAATVTEDVYRLLTRDGTIPPDADRSALALHEAVGDLRARHPRSPHLWATYAHVGP